MDITCPIRQKNDLVDWKNYFGNSILNTAYKSLSNIIQKRLKTLTEQQIFSYQVGFDKRKSIVDHVFYVNTSLKSVPGTPHVRKLERHEISSNFFFTNISMMSSFDPGLFDIIGYSKDESVLCVVAATPSPAPLHRCR
jgi:hypothetical protein